MRGASRQHIREALSRYPLGNTSRTQLRGSPPSRFRWRGNSVARFDSISVSARYVRQSTEAAIERLARQLASDF